jgi:hypothetical protein
MTTINVNENARATVLQCVGCGKLLATGAHVPRHDIAWCGYCGDYGNLYPWFECPTSGLAGFRLYRRIDGKPGKPGLLRRLGLPLGKVALGLAGGALIALAFTGAFAVGATISPRPASHTAAASPIVCR